MDGFHLAQPELERLDRQARKGAPDTFDAGGYAALLERLRAQRATDPAVYAPQFRREIEEPIAGAIGIFGVTPLVITEGNYLLFEQHGWSGVRPLLDEVWYVDLDDHRRHQRLIARHMAHGRSPAEAAIWALGNDQINAELVAATRRLADLVVAMA